jgi:triphosphoribosyl-dephospho-CoA synthase
VRTNTNLGIVLLLAPLSKCDPPSWQDELSATLESTTVVDTKAVYEAIRLAVPGGLGKVEEQDVVNEPTHTLLEVMKLAADRDLIARQYASRFGDVFQVGVPALLEGFDRFGSVERAIQHCQLRWLASIPDSLIARKLGQSAADEVSRRARSIDPSASDFDEQYAEFDRWLRADGHSRNPGTTADLVTASLFVALREGRMNLFSKW